MRHTKIVATLGPASAPREVLRGMMAAGLDVARLNLSHGTHETHAQLIRRVRALRGEVGQYVAILLDLQGPRVRVGEMGAGGVVLKEGGPYTFTAAEVRGDVERATVTYEGLAQDLSPGDRLFIEDGELAFEVESIDGSDVRCRVLSGGILRSRKGVNVPGVALRIPKVTEKDNADLRFGIEQGVDLLAMSFVTSGEDVRELKAAIHEAGTEDLPIVAKIESRLGLENLDGILEEVYAVIVARGDLALETSMEEVPVAQKRIIRACRRAGVPVITATQMLESMTRSPEPTRAEAADVANAVFDGSDALMLSGETAVGDHPVAAVRAMARIAERAEEAVRRGEVDAWDPLEPIRGDPDDTIATLAVEAAEVVDARAILAFTRSGSTALRLARQRAWAPVIAVTPYEPIARRLAVAWGVRPLICPPAETREDLADAAFHAALGEGLVEKGDTVVLAAGLPGEAPGHTNLLEIREAE